MATIESLPPESLIRIFELVRENKTFGRNGRNAALRTLAAASLVARGWREPALLWLELEVMEQRDQIMASGICGWYRMERVVLSARLFKRKGRIEEVLSSLRGLDWLEIIDSGFGSPRHEVGWLTL